MGCFIAGIFILGGIALIVEYPIPAMLILIPSGYFFIKAMNESAIKQKEIKEINKIPDNTIDVRIIDFHYGYDITTNKNAIMWIDNGELCFFEEHMNARIPIQYINYFTRLGDMYTETKGGGVSVGGAVVGGVVAGEVGAIIGSRKNVETKVVDNRETIMEVFDNKKNEISYLKFDSNAYNLFLKLIPNKEKSLVKNQETNSISNINNKTESNVNSDDIISKIEKVKELKEKGIITEEEYDKKKNELLSRI